MTTQLAGPETVTELALHVDGSQIVASVLRFDGGGVRVRLAFGVGEVGLVLETEQVAALRVLLGDVLGTAYQAERQRAA